MIKNEAKITNDVEVNINRAAIEHRATWMGLIFDESRKHAVALMMVKNSQAYSSESLVRRPSRWTYTK